ncbi:cytosine permease, partial [Aeromonas hydrophila]
VSTLLERIPKWQITIGLGILATVIGSMDIMSWFIPFLLFLGIATPPVAGIYIADFLRYRSQGYDEQLLAQEPAIKWSTFVVWILGSLVGFLTANGVITLTMIPSLDSILVASLGYLALSRRPALMVSKRTN